MILINKVETHWITIKRKKMPKTRIFHSLFLCENSFFAISRSSGLGTTQIRDVKLRGAAKITTCHKKLNQYILQNEKKRRKIDKNQTE